MNDYANKIQHRYSYLNSTNGLNFLYYPFNLYDLAVIFDGKKTTVRPIIEATDTSAYFSYKGKANFLRNFTNDDNIAPPDWALEWIANRILKLPFKVETRMSTVDKFLLNETIIRKRK